MRRDGPRVGLTHIDEHGNAHMVDVSDKDITSREAIAEGFIALGPDAMAAVVERSANKGDVLAVAQLAGITAAKRTGDLIPLCHPLPLTSVDVVLTPESGRVRCVATVKTVGRTGVEMEAMTAVSVALLTVYDMLKAVDRSMALGPVHLLRKSGGRSGTWTRTA
jgi:cyclic pyranopterin phosphate synthase